MVKMEAMRGQTIRKGVIVNGLSKISNGALSFLVLVFIAKYFGADLDTDAYLVTNSLIYLFMLTGEGMLGVAFLPIYIDYRENKGVDEARELSNSMFSFLLVILVAVSFLIFIFASQLAHALAPGFSPEAKAVTANLMRINAPLLLLIGINGIAGSIFFAYRNFTIPAVCTCFMAWGQVLSLFFFGHRLGIYSIPLGAVVGAALQAIVLLHYLEKRGEGFRLRWNPAHSGMRRIGALVLPRLATVTTAKVNIMVDRFFASTLQAGFVSALGFAQRVTQLPFMLVAEAVAKILLPVLSQHDSAGEPEQIRKKMLKTLQWLNALVIPLMIAFFVLSEPLIEILFQRGSFGVSETKLTARMLIWYNFGLLAYSYNPLLHVVYYSFQDTATPMKIAVGTLVLNFILDVILMKLMGLAGIAVTTSIVAIVRAGLLLFFLGNRLGVVDYFGIAKSMARITLASAPMGITLWVVMRIPLTFIDTSRVGSILQLCAGVVAAGLVYLGVCHLMKIEESRQIIQYFRRGVLS